MPECADGALIDGISKRLMELADQDAPFEPVGISHIFWACSNLQAAKRLNVGSLPVKAHTVGHGLARPYLVVVVLIACS